jgi:DNA-binding GntR family transcriptional regulator
MTDTTKQMQMAILTGELKPRERLVESELISRFNIKRFAVRKAIQELAHQGFVELVPNKGARVADFSDKEVEDIYVVRMNLEYLTAELTIANLTREKLSHLKQVQKEFADAVKCGVIEDMVVKNEEFHRTFYRMTENRFLTEHLEKLTNSIFFLRYHAYFLLGADAKSVEHHEAIIGAIESRDVDKLKQVLKESIIYPKMIYQSRKMGASQGSDLANRDKAREKPEKKEKKRTKVEGAWRAA